MIAMALNLVFDTGIADPDHPWPLAVTSPPLVALVLVPTAGRP